MGKRTSGLDGAARGSICGSQVGVKRTMSARPSVTAHVGMRSMNTHPKAVKAPQNIFDPVNTGLSNTQQAATYNTTGGKY